VGIENLATTEIFQKKQSYFKNLLKFFIRGRFCPGRTPPGGNREFVEFRAKLAAENSRRGCRRAKIRRNFFLELLKMDPGKISARAEF
jgi:hypothetical protein